MSLDLSAKKGLVHNTSAFDIDGTTNTDLSNVALTTFNSGDVASAGSAKLYISTSGGNADVATLPTSITLADGSELFSDGFEITLVKTTADSNKITVTDPVIGFVYSYCDRQGEALTVALDTSTGTSRWIPKI